MEAKPSGMGTVTARALFFPAHRKEPMPYINLKITRDGVTREQKLQIVQEFTATLVRVLGKKPEQTHIVIDEVDTDNWGFCGMLTTDYRRTPPDQPSPGATGQSR